LSPAYLASTSASASSTTTTSGTIFPTSPADGNIFVYLADATNGVNWTFKYNAGSASSYKWECIGGRPLWSAVAAAEVTTSATYAALGTAGPSVILPFAGDYDIAIGFHGSAAVASAHAEMSYDIGGTGAVDADFVQLSTTESAGIGLSASTAVSRVNRKTGLTVVTLTSKYKANGDSWTFKNRWMSVMPVRVTG
jgi:hypothetical protein